MGSVDDETSDREATIDAAPPGVTSPTRWNTHARGALLRVIRDDLQANSALSVSGIIKPAALALIVYRYGQWVFARRGSGSAVRLGEKLYWILFAAARNQLGIELVATAELGRGVRIEHQHGIVIHPFAVIGDEVQIHHGVTIGLNNEQELATIQQNVPHIGTRVVIGVGATIIGAVVIGDGARIGPHALVTRDVPPGASVVAAPSRILRLSDGGAGE